MKAGVITDARVLEVQEVPEPEMAPDKIKVKIAYCGICGSELHTFDPAFSAGLFLGRQQARKGPSIMGHEACGTIVEIGGNCIMGYRVGQKVAMNFRSPCGACYYCRNGKEHFCEKVTPASGGYAEYAVYKENDIYALPDDISLEIGALLEPVSVAVHTLDLANVHPGSSVAILGAGPIGLLIQELALKAGAARILVSEPVEGRRLLAKQLGADIVVDPLKEKLEEAAQKLTGGRGFDSVIDATGKLAIAEQAVTLADYGGTIVWAAMYPIDVKAAVSPALMYTKELTIRSVNISPYCFPRSIHLLSKLELKPLISIMPLKVISKAFEILIKGNAIKVLIKP